MLRSSDNFKRSDYFFNKMCFSCNFFLHIQSISKFLYICRIVKYERMRITERVKERMSKRLMHDCVRGMTILNEYDI